MKIGFYQTKPADTVDLVTKTRPDGVYENHGTLNQVIQLNDEFCKQPGWFLLWDDPGGEPQADAVLPAKPLGVPPARFFEKVA